MSRTIGSPAAMTRSDASWCGEAEFGPEPTIAKWASSCPSAIEPLADLARDVGLGPADESTAGDLRDDPIGGVGRLGQQRDLVGVLDDAQPAEDRRAELEPDTGQSLLEAEQVPGRQVVRDEDGQRRRIRPVAAHHPRDEGVRVIRLLPGDHRQVTRGRGRTQSRGGRLEPRRDEGRASLGRDHQHRQPLEGHRRVARQVAHVGADADQDRAIAGRPPPPTARRRSGRGSAPPGSSGGP